MILGLYSGLVVGWSTPGHTNRRLALGALDLAMGCRHPGPGLLHRSDLGSQYACAGYQQALKSHGMVCSMGRKGDCRDNALMESFFHTLKTKLVHHRDCQTRWEAEAGIFQYIEAFYNRGRRHSALGFVTPAEYEMIMLAA